MTTFDALRRQLADRDLNTDDRKNLLTRLDEIEENIAVLQRSAVMAHAAEARYAAVLSSTVVFDPPSLAAGAVANTTVGIAGAAVGQPVAVAFGLAEADIMITAQVTAVEVVTVVFFNAGVSVINMASADLVVYVLSFTPGVLLS